MTTPTFAGYDEISVLGEGGLGKVLGRAWPPLPARWVLAGLSAAPSSLAATPRETNASHSREQLVAVDRRRWRRGCLDATISSDHLSSGLTVPEFRRLHGRELGV